MNMRKRLDLLSVHESTVVFNEGGEYCKERKTPTLCSATIDREVWLELGKPLIVTLEVGLGHMAQDEDAWS